MILLCFVRYQGILAERLPAPGPCPLTARGGQDRKVRSRSVKCDVTAFQQRFCRMFRPCYDGWSTSKSASFLLNANDRSSSKHSPREWSDNSERTHARAAIGKLWDLGAARLAP